MQFDSTRIVIRERSFPDIMDLALRVFRTHAGPLLAAFVLGITPFVVLNQLLLRGFRDPLHFEAVEHYLLYYLLLAILIVWEMPLATAAATLFLGQAVFVGRPQPRQIAGDLVRALPQLLLFQVMIRGLLSALLVPWLILFGARPFMNEIILLERTPLRNDNPRALSTFQRAKLLHRNLEGWIVGRWIASVFMGTILWGSLLGSLWGLGFFLFHILYWEASVQPLVVELVTWTVIAFFTVVRFLGYLDLRIRREGWEVELLLRAEGARLARQIP